MIAIQRWALLNQETIIWNAVIGFDVYLLYGELLRWVDTVMVTYGSYLEIYI